MNRFLSAFLAAIVFSLIILSFKTASVSDALWIEANEAYHNRDYSRAKELYSQIESDIAPYSSAAVYYNKANTLFRLKDYSNALLYYLKAERINPRDTDVKANIRRCRAALGVNMPGHSMLYNMLSFLKIEEWVVLFVFSIWGLIFFLVGKGLKHSIKASFAVFFGISSVLLCFGIVLYLNIVGINWRLAVRKSVLYSGPSEKETKLGDVIAGDMLKELSVQGQWVKVYLPGKKEAGWIKPDIAPKV